MTEWLGNEKMIRLGEILIIIGIGIMLLPMGTMWTLIGLVAIGLGCAPVYPCLIHETPRKFGEEYSQAMIGVQMATAYVGTTFMPPIFGILAQHISIQLYPWTLMVLVLLMLINVERDNFIHKKEAAH